MGWKPEATASILGDQGMASTMAKSTTIATVMPRIDPGDSGPVRKYETAWKATSAPKMIAAPNPPNTPTPR